MSVICSRTICSCIQIDKRLQVGCQADKLQRRTVEMKKTRNLQRKMVDISAKQRDGSVRCSVQLTNLSAISNAEVLEALFFCSSVKWAVIHVESEGEIIVVILFVAEENQLCHQRGKTVHSMSEGESDVPSNDEKILRSINDLCHLRFFALFCRWASEFPRRYSILLHSTHPTAYQDSSFSSAPFFRQATNEEKGNDNRNGKHQNATQLR